MESIGWAAGVAPAVKSCLINWFIITTVYRIVEIGNGDGSEKDPQDMNRLVFIRPTPTILGNV